MLKKRRLHDGMPSQQYFNPKYMTTLSLNSASPHCKAVGQLNGRWDIPVPAADGIIDAASASTQSLSTYDLDAYYQFDLPTSWPTFANRPCTVKAAHGTVAFSTTFNPPQGDAELTPNNMVKGESYLIDKVQQTADVPATSVNTVTNELTSEENHLFSTQDPVVYTAPNTPISTPTGNLVSGQTYFVIRENATKFKLALTAAAAATNAPIPFNGQGVGTHVFTSTTEFEKLGARSRTVGTVFTYNGGFTLGVFSTVGLVKDMRAFELPGQVHGTSCILTNIEAQGVNYGGNGVILDPSTVSNSNNVVSLPLSTSSDAHAESTGMPVKESFMPLTFRCPVGLPQVLKLTMGYTQLSQVQKNGEASAIPRVVRPTFISLYLEIYFDEE